MGRPRNTSDKLTEREAQVYLHVISGFTNQQIANKLGLALKTVKWNMTKIMQKRQVKSRMELVIQFFNEEKERMERGL